MREVQHKKGKALDIVIEPDPRLHQKSEPVGKVDDEIKGILDDMAATMYKHNGVGLSAVQVGIMRNIIVVDHDYCIQRNPKSAEEVKELGAPLFMVNAEIIEASEETAVEQEGCLSLPGVYTDIKRPAKVKAKYLDYDGKEQTIEAEGLLGACIQHEIDHSNGIVITDYVSPLKRKMLNKKLEKYKKRMEL